MDYIDEKLLTGIITYCEINELNVKEYINKLLTNAFNLDRYGQRPNIGCSKQTVEKVIDTNDNNKNDTAVICEQVMEEKPIIKKRTNTKKEKEPEEEKIEVKEQTKRRKLK